MNIIDILGRRDREIKERFHVKRIGLFGSFARGEETETSNADIMVEFVQPTFDRQENGAGHARFFELSHCAICKR